MTTNKTTVIKQNTDNAVFDADTLYHSIEAACLSISLAEGVAKDTAHHTCLAVEQWLQNKQEVTSADIRRVATDTLTVFSPEASYLYKHYHTIL